MSHMMQHRGYTQAFRRLWKLLRDWMKSASPSLELPGLTRQDRFFVHRWCHCWTGVTSQSFGEEPDRVLRVERGQAVCRRQFPGAGDPAPEVNPEETSGESTGRSSGEEQEGAVVQVAAVPKRRRVARKPAAQLSAADCPELGLGPLFFPTGSLVHCPSLFGF